tara:strand:+ start:11701 stop:12585 length:885 start_codon:yes stop_codon:yes gene_type:complete
MAEFKPMVKMSTSQPKEVLKFAKGGSVTTKMVNANQTSGYEAYKNGGKVGKADGGAMGALDQLATAKMASKRMGKKPPMPMGGRPIASKPPMGGMPPPMGGMPPPAMKKGGMAEGGKSDMSQDKAMIKKAMKQHDMQEHKGGKGTDLKLKKGGKAYKDGGSVGKAARVMSATAKPMPTDAVAKPTKNTINSGTPKFAKTDMETAYTGSGMKSYPKTGKGVDTKTGGYKDGGTVGVKKGNAGGFATGGVAKSNAGGFRDGGPAKKPFATGGAVKMEQGKKKPSPPVAINQLSGTF